MLEKIIKLYVMAMAGDVRSPLPHLFGPPGCGKSTVVEQLAELLGVNLHVINLSRVSPLELEGVQMPHTEGEAQKLKLLHATFWTQIKEGDIVLFDEALRAFPEVFNGLLDILTSRRVADLVLPKAFFIAASNSTVAYDKALEDRLLHLPVPDPRKSKREKNNISTMIVDTLGLMPEMKSSHEMTNLLASEILPMYDVLDDLGGTKVRATAQIKGHSIRNLLGQAQLREVHSAALAELLDINNQRAVSAGKGQYVFLYDGSKIPGNYATESAKLKSVSHKLTEIQRHNLELNLQLIELEATRNEKEENDGDNGHDDDIFNP